MADHGPASKLPMAPPAPEARLVRIKLDEKSVVRRRPEVEHELSLARADLLHNNCFAPIGFADDGPFCLTLSLEENRVRLHLDAVAGREAVDARPLTDFTLPLSPFRGIIREYFMVCESYYDAISAGAGPAQIETLDMGRRGLHNQGSELLMDVLKDKAQMDFYTARRLFTLICVLHVRG